MSEKSLAAKIIEEGKPKKGILSNASLKGNNKSLLTMNVKDVCSCLQDEVVERTVSYVDLVQSIFEGKETNEG